MSVLSVALSAAVGALAGAVARPVVFARSVPAPASWRSSCPHCGSTVIGRRPLPLLPVSGRCPTCTERIGPPALSAEILAAAVFAAVAAGGASGWVAAAQYWLAACGIALALIDLAVQRLPDVLTLPACAGTLLLLTGAALAGGPGSLGRAAAAAGVLTAVFLLLAIFTGMGLGDVKLAPAVGALLGWSSWTNVWWGAAAGFVVGAVCAAALLAAGCDRRSQIAFGPFMVIGALAVSLTTI
ncbi:A24 family peptidase [Streptomyces sp. NBC_01142]|uniref:prepilin peptidase n=1 Tax=Streptomyces sp. NBC_01142 TaxID=2975865 RepID=UPI002258D913|nr:A24 family peptidase [Streptomyces sp. NBC_01142]MCX4826163.1 A24 family peptidase [Streptomyces sp. NBC_01142]